MIAMDSKEVKDVLKEWKDKKLNESFRISIFNIILRKASVKALQLEEDINIPPHFSLPFLNTNKEYKDKK